jgi:hypothetical protein
MTRRSFFVTRSFFVIPQSLCHSAASLSFRSFFVIPQSLCHLAASLSFRSEAEESAFVATVNADLCASLRDDK